MIAESRVGQRIVARVASADTDHGYVEHTGLVIESVQNGEASGHLLARLEGSEVWIFEDEIYAADGRLVAA